MSVHVAMDNTLIISEVKQSCLQPVSSDKEMTEKTEQNAFER